MDPINKVYQEEVSSQKDSKSHQLSPQNLETKKQACTDELTEASGAAVAALALWVETTLIPLSSLVWNSGG